MDNSNVFQLMLSKAVEIDPQGFQNFDRTKNVQDQLQEMVGSNWICRHTSPFFELQRLLDKFRLFEQELTNKGRFIFPSMEQLWLAFVMKECYNKEWSITENEWVSLSESLAQNVKGKE